MKRETKKKLLHLFERFVDASVGVAFTELMQWLLDHLLKGG